jgi:hypothetical protein
VSELVGTAYHANVLRIDTRSDGGAQVVVEFIPRPPETTLKIELGTEMIEIPLPPGVSDAPVPQQQLEAPRSIS